MAHKLGMAATILIVLAALFGTLTSCAKPATTPSQTSPPPTSAAKPAPATAPATTSAPSPAAKPAPSPVVYKFAVNVAPTGALGDCFSWWASEVQKRSGGTIKIDISFAESLFKAKDVNAAVGRGAADIGQVGPQYSPDKLPLMNYAQNAAFLTPQAIAQVKALSEMVRTPPLANEFKSLNLKPVAIHETGSHQFLTTKPMKAMADLKGLKIRSFDPYATIIARVGAAPITMSSNEVYEGLQKGTIVGVHWGIDNFTREKLYEVAKYVTMANIGSGGATLAINLDVWNKMSPETRTMIEKLGEEWVQHQDDVFRAYDEKGMETLKNNSVQISTLPTEERNKMKVISDQVAQEWADTIEKQGISARAFLQTLSATVKKYETAAK